MPLDRLNIEKIRRAVRDAYYRGRKSMEKMRTIARELQIRELAHHEVNAVAFVAADGGNRTSTSSTGGGFFNPVMIEMVRVVDSRGKECIADAIAVNNEESADWQQKTRNIEPLKVLCRDLEVDCVSNLSPYLSGQSRQRTAEVYREIAEWASVYCLAVENDWGSDTMLVHEGSLRSGVFQPEIFRRLGERFHKAHQRQKENGVTVSLVGISKSSVLLSRLSTALALEGIFEKDYPCYTKIDRETAEEFYKKRWLDTVETASPNEDPLSMGEMYLVKFGKHPLSPVWMVDVAYWQKTDASKVLGQLAADARPGFPIPDFPMCVQQAHDFARVGPLEISVFSDMLTEEIGHNLSEHERERLFRLKYLGEDITARRYGNA